MLVGLLVLALGCSDGEPAATGDADGDAAAPAATETQTRVDASGEPVAADERRGVPLPAFEGVNLDGQPLSLSALIGKRFVLFGFNPQVESAERAAAALGQVAAARADYNFDIVGVAVGAPAAEARALLEAHGLEGIRAFDDNRAEIGRRIGFRSPVWLLLVDAEGNMLRVISNFGLPPNQDSVAEITGQLREMLRLPGGGGAENPDALALLGGGLKPEAPPLTALDMRDGSTFRLADNLSRGVALVFFLHTCPHCHRALTAIQTVLDTIPEAERPLLVGVSSLDRPLSVLPMLEDEGIKEFRVLRDPDASIRRAYGAVHAVPVTLLINSEGRIESRVEGWREERDPALMRMRLIKLAGGTPPMLLHSTGYSGNEFCGVCHESETVTWELTRHAGAYDTLVKHGADHQGECVSCHVVGYGQPGGFELARPLATLEAVGCETCHGRGGPHLSQGFAPGHDYEAVCVTCHNPEHSLGFEYASFLPKVSHAAMLAIAALPAEQRAQRLAEQRPPRNRLPMEADYVGTPACLSCHEQEYETWAAHEHARAYQTLEAKGEAGNGDCLRCHTTGYGQPTGFPTGGADDHAGLEGVGCESCHGPGGNHAPPEASKRGTILSLGDKCDSCVILQICGSCHDDANDPGFEFEVLDKIEKQRHGTSGALRAPPHPVDRAKPLPEGALRTPPPLNDGAMLALLDRALDDGELPATAPGGHKLGGASALPAAARTAARGSQKTERLAR